MSATGELVLATLFLAPTAERETELRRAAAALADWDGALVALEAHGVLGLALRNLVCAGAEVPPAVLARLCERAAAMRAIDIGFRLTLVRFLEAAQHDGIDVVLLKGASLSLDLYPERGLRMQGDLDLLVRPEHVLRALAAARRIGLHPPRKALPAWWYWLAHFHLKLVPADGLQRELELHWHLHPRSRLHTVRLEALLERRKRVELGPKAWTLDPLDRLLHLATHLVRHCPLDGLPPGALRALAADPRAPLRLKWLLDVRAEVEHRCGALAPAELARRAAEWNAEAELALVLAWMKDELGFAGEAGAWVADVLAQLPARPARGRPGIARDRHVPGLDFRLSALRAFPRWIWPERTTLARLSADGSASPARRLGHAARVLGRAGLVAAITPLAWLASLVRFAPEQRLAPEALLELSARARLMALSDEAASS